VKRNRRVVAVVLATAVLVVATYAGWTRIRAPGVAARDDSYPVYIALLKGLPGDVVYVGSDDTHAYFRLGKVFWTYYKLLSCAAPVPEPFPIQRGRAYVVKLKVRNGNVVHSSKECHGPDSYTIGELERV
jgi:hypothetical protein